MIKKTIWLAIPRYKKIYFWLLLEFLVAKQRIIKIPQLIWLIGIDLVLSALYLVWINPPLRHPIEIPMILGASTSTIVIVNAIGSMITRRTS